MSNMRMKHKLIMSMMAGMIIIPGSVVRTQAAETDNGEKSLVPVTGIENMLEYLSVVGGDKSGACVAARVGML